MFSSVFTLFKSLASLLHSLRKELGKKLTKGKLNDLSGLIVTTIVLLSVQAFNTLIILFILDYLIIYLKR